MKTPASSPGSLITAVVATPFFTTGTGAMEVEVIEVGVHRKVRVHSCDDIISSDRANFVSPMAQLRGIATLGLFCTTLWVLRR